VKIQFAVVLKNRLGEEIIEPAPGGGQKTVSLGDICSHVLDMSLQDDIPTLTDKMRRWELIRKITEADKSLKPLELLDADIEMIKTRLGKHPTLSVSVMGYAIGLLSQSALEMGEDHASGREESEGDGANGDAQVQARPTSQRKPERAGSAGPTTGDRDRAF
jgi:hypothetical protein